MADNSVAADQDSLRKLLVDQGIRHVAIVDDAFDPIDVRDLSEDEKLSLWTTIETNDEVRNEISQLQLVVNSADDIDGELVARLLRGRARIPKFGVLWDKSQVANDIATELSGVETLARLLRELFDVEVREFGSTAETDQLIEYDPQLLFLDWHLGYDAVPTVEEATAGSEPPVAVQAATLKVKEILQGWPEEKPKPLIVLMSSRPSMPQDADEFCRRSNILRGMFHAVPKSALGEPFSLRMHMQLFAKSLPEGRRIQTFLDALRGKFQIVRDQFLDDISDLSLNDYSYIQSLTLKNDDQPLGDYLQQLFSSYLGQLLFAEALGDEWAELDVMTFGEALPSLAPPSGRLTKVYHTALFDTSVGSIDSHPLAAQTSDSAANYLPVLALGDILKRESTNGDASCELEATELEQPLEDGAGIAPKPDLFLLINAQCDLEIRPNSSSQLSVDERSILLLPGYLKLLLEANGDDSKPKTELYEHEGSRYRIEWDTKKVLAIPHGQFNDWKLQEKLERVARLRLPYALEIQRAFAANLTRVGTLVTPPIYQPVAASLLRATEGIYTASSALQDEAAFLVFTKAGQQCVLTIPLLAMLKEVLDERLADMRAEFAQIQSSGDNPSNLERQIDALDRAIKNESKWATLRLPFDLPKMKSPKKFFDDRIQIVRGKREGDTCASKIVVAVSLDLDEVGSQ
ncbi:MAG: hypothetical protein OXO50_11740 [Caldilineaceae bacterium]|nr:hypothetical protein [Caldilineaceae bacterium]